MGEAEQAKVGGFNIEGKAGVFQFNFDIEGVSITLFSLSLPGRSNERGAKSRLEVKGKDEDLIATKEVFAKSPDNRLSASVQGRKTILVPQQPDGRYELQPYLAAAKNIWRGISTDTVGAPHIIRDPQGFMRTQYQVGSTIFSFYRESTVITYDGYANGLKREYIFLDIVIEDQEIDRFVFIPLPSLPENIPLDERAIGTTQKRIYYLDWPPKKLGDGSYGVVFKASDERRDYAVKVLYARQFATRTGLMDVKTSSLEDLESGGDKISIQKRERTKTSDPVRRIPFTTVLDLAMKGITNRIAGGINSDKSISLVSSLLNDIIEFSDRSTNLSKLRFKAEESVSEDIQRSLRQRNAVAVASNYVKVEASCDFFRSTPAYAALKRYYESLSVAEARNLSDFAIIMDFCSFTLKDLLEWEWEIVQDKDVVKLSRVVQSSTKNGADSKTIIGYNLLEKIPYFERVTVILPFLFGVVRGLHTLHLAGKEHHDIKPGNIFIQLSDTSFDVLLGDFSFVAQAAEAGTSEAVLRDVIITGTPHFRSPEQRDFAEVYQAQVMYICNETNSDSEEFVLRIADPKFHRSISTSNECLVFSADPDGRLYGIKCVEKIEQYTYIYLEAATKALRNKFPEANTTTQVTIYKLPTMLSDIFGVGAIAYDLITGGRSAERFYEILRVVDYIGSDYNVDYICNMYEDYCAGKAIGKNGDALKEVFYHFQGNGKGDNCPPILFGLIIKCISMNVDGSFSKMYLEDKNKAVQILNEILGILNELQVDHFPRNSVNFLINPCGAHQWNIIKEKLIMTVSNISEGDIQAASEKNTDGALKKAIGRLVGAFAKGKNGD